LGVGVGTAGLRVATGVAPALVGVVIGVGITCGIIFKASDCAGVADGDGIIVAFTDGDEVGTFAGNDELGAAQLSLSMTNRNTSRKIIAPAMLAIFTLLICNSLDRNIEPFLFV
jgi:hypothetical protein